MSEGAGAQAPPGGTSAGRLLREAREKQGLHIAALAAAIKVSPKKLEMLESDRFDALPDATFARALAQTVCRALKIDPAPVMRLLPPPSGHRLESVGEGLNTPFRERPGAAVQSSQLTEAFGSPGYWFAGLLLIAAVAVYFLPFELFGTASPGRPASAPAGAARVEPGMPPGAGPAGADAASAPAASLGASTAVTTGAMAASAPEAGAPAVPSAGAGGADTAAPSAAASLPAAGEASAGVVQLRTTAPSWVEVTDGRGQALVSRVLQAGESIGLDGAPPFRVRIGNAAGTELLFRGQPTDLQAFTRDNVARLELR